MNLKSFITLTWKWPQIDLARAMGEKSYNSSCDLCYGKRMEKENQCQNDIQAVRKWRGGYPNVTSPIFPSLAIVSNCKYNQKSEGKGTQVMKAMKVSFPGHRAGQWGTGGEMGKTITSISYLIDPEDGTRELAFYYCVFSILALFPF